MVEGTDYDLNLSNNKDLVNATTKKSLTVTVEPKNGYRGTNLVFDWGIDKFNLSNADVSVKDGNVTVKCGSITVPSADYTVTKDWSYVKKKYKLNTTNFLFLCNC